MTQPDKLPPHDTLAEESVIGSLLIDDSCMVRLAVLLDTGDFFREPNGWIFAACKGLYERAEAINQITVAHELEQQGKLAEAGGATYLAHCVSIVPTSLHAEGYANIVRRTATMRKLIQAGGRIAQLGYENGPEVDKALSRAEELIFALRQGGTGTGFVHLREVLDVCATEMTAPKGERRAGLRIPTGFVDLDRILGGFHPSDLVILAGRPGHGKTSLCLNLAEQVALNGKLRVGIFSLEMSRDQVAYRLLASHAGVDLQRLTLGRLNEGEERRVVESLGVLSELAIYIDDTAGQRMSEIRGRAKQLANQYGLDLIVVDFLGLAHSTRRTENRAQEVGEVSRELKALAKELGVPVLAAAQLNRAVEQRPDHRPMLSDLRESGELEQNADVVLFIYREDQYTDEAGWSRKNPTKPYPKGIAGIIVAKHRNGPTGECSLLFQGANTRFVALETHRETGETYYWQG